VAHGTGDDLQRQLERLWELPALLPPHEIQRSRARRRRLLPLAAVLLCFTVAFGVMAFSPSPALRDGLAGGFELMAAMLLCRSFGTLVCTLETTWRSPRTRRRM